MQTANLNSSAFMHESEGCTVNQQMFQVMISMQSEWREERKMLQQERLQWQRERTGFMKHMEKMSQRSEGMKMKLIEALKGLHKRNARVEKKFCPLHGLGSHGEAECHHLRRKREEGQCSGGSQKGSDKVLAVTKDEPVKSHQKDVPDQKHSVNKEKGREIRLRQTEEDLKQKDQLKKLELKISAQKVQAENQTARINSYKEELSKTSIEVRRLEKIVQQSKDMAEKNFALGKELAEANNSLAEKNAMIDQHLEELSDQHMEIGQSINNNRASCTIIRQLMDKIELCECKCQRRRKLQALLWKSYDFTQIIPTDFPPGY